MELFKLETPVMNKIKSFYEERKTANKIPANTVMEFLDYKPDEGFLQSDIDGAVSVYGSEINFPDSAGTNTEEQDNISFLTIDVYGFGAPLPKAQEEPNIVFSTAREAQNRAEVLTALAYQAIMDRREIKGAPEDNIEKAFGSGVDFGVDKYPVSIKRFDTIGTMRCKRGVVIYRSIYKFGLQEQTIQETLGIPYAGSDNIESETYNPNTDILVTFVTSDGLNLETTDNLSIISYNVLEPDIPTLFVGLITSDGSILETSDDLSIISYNVIY